MLKEVLMNVIYVIIIGVLPILTKMVVSYIGAKKEDIDDSIYDSALKTVIDSSITLVQNVVDTVSQTYVDALKKEKKFDEESQKKAFQMALDKVKSMLTDYSVSVLQSTYKDVDKWIEVQIESYINMKKRGY